MATNVVVNPYEYFNDPNVGRPIFNGDIYVGIVDLDPEIPANQKQVTARQEDGTEVEIGQPVKTNSGGNPTYNGSPIVLLVEGAYSIKVLDKQGNQEFYQADVTKGVPVTAVTISNYTSYVFNSVEDAKAGVLPDLSVINLDIGDSILTNGYYSVNDGGEASYIVVAGSTGVDDGGSYIDLDNGNQLELIVTGGRVNIRQFGANPTASTGANNTAITNALAFSSNVFMPTGLYEVNTTFTISEGQQLIGDGIADGVQLRPTGDASTVLSYTGIGVVLNVIGSSTAIKNFAISDKNGTGLYMIWYNADANAINGGHLEDVLVYGTTGKALFLEAKNSGFIAYCNFYNFRVRNSTIGIDIDAPGGGAGFINTNQWFGGSITGGAHDYGIHAQGGNDNRFYGMSVEGTTFSGGAIRTEASAYIIFDGRVEATAQDDDVAVIYCAPGSSESMLGGLGAAGLVQDFGQNEITFTNAKCPQAEPTTFNLLDNASFSAATATTVPGWTITGAGVTLSSTESVLFDGVRTLEIIVPAGVICTMKQNIDTTIYDGKTLTLGGWIDADESGIATWTLEDNSSLSSGVPSTGISSPEWLGVILNTITSPTSLKAGLSINNSAGVAPVNVSVTIPTLVTGFHLQIPSPKVLHEGKARMNGQFSENFGTIGTAANQMVLKPDGNNYIINGNTLITRINQAAADRFPVGTVITLYADSGANLNVSDNAFILLTGNFTAAKEWDSITLISNLPGLWIEKSRSLL